MAITVSTNYIVENSIKFIVITVKDNQDIITNIKEKVNTWSDGSSLANLIKSRLKKNLDTTNRPRNTKDIII